MHLALSRNLFEEQINLWPPDLAESRGWVIHAVSYPTVDISFTAIDRTTLRLSCDFSDWDELPPSIDLLNAEGVLLAKLPQKLPGVFNGGAHPRTGRPFVCMAGSREFHTHPSHRNETWDQCRDQPGFEDIGAILTKLWHAWQKGTG